MRKATRNIPVAAALAVLLAILLATPILWPRPDAGRSDAGQPAAAAQSVPVLFAQSQTEAIDMTVSVIDVGQGDSILVTSEGMSLLVDAGDTASGGRVVAYLRGQGVERIDYLVATHGDADHIGGMAAVLAAFDLGHDIIAPAAQGSSKTYENFVLAVEQEPGIGFTTPEAGSRFQLGDATVEVIANGDGELRTNDSSIVLKVTCGGKSALLTGDMPDRVELKLVQARAPIDSDILKVGHHGSRHSSCTAFLEAVSPDYAVISCGKNNYGHPAPEAVARLTKIGAALYNTADSGTVVFLFSDGVITPPKAA